jgi:acid phosphatase family membrane protein YuiD
VGAQIIKSVIYSIRHRKFLISRLVGLGGMPSSHAATVVCLATVVGKNAGVGSLYFAMSCAFAFFVMIDAASVRRASGKQAAVINKLLHHNDINWDTPDGKPHIELVLKELLGHTPLEVLAGAALGIFTGVLWG